MTESHPSTSEKQSLRRRLCAQRQSLDKTQRTLYAEQFSHTLRQCKAIVSGLKIAFYFPIKSEAPADLVIQLFPDKELFAPKILDYKLGIMAFTALSDQMNKNQWGILEPESKQACISVEQLDAIIMPLVAFDRLGNRLGMGGGFYDRALSFKKNNRSKTKPQLIGLAYDFQQVERVPTESWDIALDMVVTNEQVIYNWL